MQSLPKLFFMRRKGKSNQSVDVVSRPGKSFNQYQRFGNSQLYFEDIRTLYINFILSFVDTTVSSSVKTLFLEQRREVFLSMFKGLIQDPYLVVQKVLEVCWAGIWSDHKIKRTLKVGLFNEACLSQVCFYTYSLWYGV